MLIQNNSSRTVTLICAIAVAGFSLSAAEKAKPTSPPQPLYKQLKRPNVEGIGKFYMGREISHVMGHRGAKWLERPEREREEGTTEMINCLKLKPGNNVADIGVGTGYIAWRMAKKIGPEGTVYGVDIQPEMLEHLAQNMAKRGLKNVKGVMGTIKDPKLPPNSIDLVIMVDVYHEFSFPYEMM